MEIVTAKEEHITDGHNGAVKLEDSEDKKSMAGKITTFALSHNEGLEKSISTTGGEDFILLEFANREQRSFPVNKLADGLGQAST